MPCPPNLQCFLITVSFKLFFLILFYRCCALNLPDIFSWSLGFMSFLLVFLTSLLVFLAFDVSFFFNMLYLCTVDCFRFVFLHLRAYITLLQVGHIPDFLFHIICNHLDDSFKSFFLQEKICHTFHYFWKGLDEWNVWVNSLTSFHLPRKSLFSLACLWELKEEEINYCKCSFFSLISAFLTNLVCLNCFFSFCLPCSQAQTSPSLMFDRCLFNHGNFLSCLLFWKEV